MKGSKAHLERALALLLPLGPVQARAMFGGHGLYLEGVMFALLGPDLHLKVDDETKPRFAAAGGVPFTYQREGRRPVEMSFWKPPTGALADAGALLPWAELAVAAARRAKAKKAGKKARRR